MSETNELEALLRRWAELEPERCRIVTGQNSGHAYEVFRLFITPAGDDYEFDTGNECFYEIEIQGTIQKAIEARGWIWHMQNAFNQDGVDCYVAYLSGINEEEEFACDSPATALLTAYLAAIESTTP